MDWGEKRSTRLQTEMGAKSRNVETCYTDELIFNLESNEDPFKVFQAIKCLDQIFIL